MDSNDTQEKWQVQLRKGALELVILAALREQPVYGLALLRHLQHFPTTAITEGTLYPLLDRLAASPRRIDRLAYRGLATLIITGGLAVAALVGLFFFVACGGLP